MQVELTWDSSLCKPSLFIILLAKNACLKDLQEQCDFQVLLSNSNPIKYAKLLILA
jgi:hypothetical protein